MAFVLPHSHEVLTLLPQCPSLSPSHAKLIQWASEREANLPDVANVSSSGQARNLIKLLDASVREIESLRTSSLAALCELGARLKAENYERAETVLAREAQLHARTTELEQLLLAKKPGFEDALAREALREQVRCRHPWRRSRWILIDQ